MRTLPRNISAHPDGWLVRVVRNRVTYQAFVAYGFGSTEGNKGSKASASPASFPSLPSVPSSLLRAVALRDNFLRIVGEVRANRHRVHGHSNTGYAGISETENWRHNRPHPCFSVHWNVPRANRQPGQRGTIAKMKRFCYGPQLQCSREQALARAITHRERMTGLKLTTLN